MKITCLIVEDEPLARNLMIAYVEKVPYLQLLKACSNPLDAIDFLRDNAVDLLFLDVQMPEITGITLLKVLRKKPFVILTTAYSEYALEGYELDILDYLLKPITFERFLKAVEKANQRMNIFTKNPTEIVISEKTEPKQNFIFVKDGTKQIKVRLSDILYIESLKDYVRIYTKTQKIVSLLTMKALEAQLPVTEFIRIHNSFIVSFEAIEAIDKEKVQIGETFLPVSDTYKKSFKEFIEGGNLGKSL